jgi:hypothetical protein
MTRAGSKQALKGALRNKRLSNLPIGLRAVAQKGNASEARRKGGDLGSPVNSLVSWLKPARRDGSSRGKKTRYVSWAHGRQFLARGTREWLNVPFNRFVETGGQMNLLASVRRVGSS